MSAPDGLESPSYESPPYENLCYALRRLQSIIPIGGCAAKLWRESPIATDGRPTPSENSSHTPSARGLPVGAPGFMVDSICQP